jgi:hypothetical protein
MILNDALAPSVRVIGHTSPFALRPYASHRPGVFRMLLTMTP